MVATSWSPASRPSTTTRRCRQTDHPGRIGTLELRDLYYEHRLDRSVRLGKQQIVWGRLDGVKILDVVNPQTFREFILDDLEFAHRPVECLPRSEPR
jgi:hypothetical protein